MWIRKSGERGGAHYENDTSFHALSDYINRNREELIILAGDKKEDKTTKLVETDRNRVFDLTEFWKVRGLEDWGGNTRTGQLRLYDYINKASNGNLKHIGSMSGGLEALALLGHNVMFKGKMGEGSVARMEQYKENSNINYDWIGFKRYSPLGYDYRGYEKSAAKYYVFFSSIGILSLIHI